MALDFARLLRHLFARPAHALYPADALQRIAHQIAQGERTHRGQVCFAVESSLPLAAVIAGHDARARAQEAFARLRVWDTAANNGVLVYLLLADHDIEIVADRGVAACIDDAQWRDVCAQMEQRLARGEGEAAALVAIERVSALLATHFPRGEGDVDHNELPDLPTVL